jgi:hypothetical protein
MGLQKKSANFSKYSSEFIASLFKGLHIRTLLSFHIHCALFRSAKKREEEQERTRRTNRHQDNNHSKILIPVLI